LAKLMASLKPDDIVIVTFVPSALAGWTYAA
jgi:hypothetical protein